MNISDFNVAPDLSGTFGFLLALAAGAVVLVSLFLGGPDFDDRNSRNAKVLRTIGALAVTAALIGLIGVLGTGMAALGNAASAGNEHFHSALQSTYGATTDADLRTAKHGESIPVRTSRGNELVTFRQTGGQLVAFRAAGTELPRSK